MRYLLILMITITLNANAGTLKLKCQHEDNYYQFKLETVELGTCQTNFVQLNSQRVEINLCDNKWAEVHVNGTVLTTPHDCQIFKEIETNYPCGRPNRHAHTGGC